LATFFTLANLVFGLWAVTEGKMNIFELPGIILSSVVIFALSLLFSVAITVPASIAVATCAYPFLQTLQAVDQRAFGVVGFLVGALIWLGIWWSAPAGNLYFGSWISLFVIAGPAGCAGGLAFSRYLAPRGN
jgi:hypothetical protein